MGGILISRQQRKEYLSLFDLSLDTVPWILEVVATGAGVLWLVGSGLEDEKRSVSIDSGLETKVYFILANMCCSGNEIIEFRNVESSFFVVFWIW